MPDANYDSGEYAVLVRSDLKGRGLGYLLMQLIIEYARAEGLADHRRTGAERKHRDASPCAGSSASTSRLDPRDPDTYIVKLAIREPVPIS